MNGDTHDADYGQFKASSVWWGKVNKTMIIKLLLDYCRTLKAIAD